MLTKTPGGRNKSVVSHCGMPHDYIVALTCKTPESNFWVLQWRRELAAFDDLQHVVSTKARDSWRHICLVCKVLLFTAKAKLMGLYFLLPHLSLFFALFMCYMHKHYWVAFDFRWHHKHMNCNVIWWRSSVLLQLLPVALMTPYSHLEHCHPCFLFSLNRVPLNRQH